MKSNRRTFMQQSIGVAMAAAAGQALAASPAASDESGPGLIKRMQWLNEPASTSQHDGHLIIRSRPRTDFWRKTFYGYITDNGHFYHFPVRGDFTFQARVNGKYAAQYDQAGLMVRLDEQQWMKCGSELVDGRR